MEATILQSASVSTPYVLKIYLKGEEVSEITQKLENIGITVRDRSAPDF